MRISEGTTGAKVRETSKPQEEQGVSPTEESVPGKDCGRILNSEHSKDPALIIFLDTKCGKVI